MGQEQQTEREALLAKRDELRARLNAIEKDYRQGLAADSEEQAVELENAEVLEAIAKSTAEELQRIEARLAGRE
jgi:RNA polymerase-binding transcription factor DksA